MFLLNVFPSQCQTFSQDREFQPKPFMLTPFTTPSKQAIDGFDDYSTSDCAASDRSTECDDPMINLNEIESQEYKD